jgi:hypothetical protein
MMDNETMKLNCVNVPKNVEANKTDEIRTGNIAFWLCLYC